MWDKVFSTTSVIILVLVGSLLLSSGLAFFTDIASTVPVGIVQSYAGFALIGLSVILAIMNLVFIKHPPYEYWLVIMIGGMVGAIYVA